MLSDGNPRMLLLQWDLSSLGLCWASSDNFIVVRYTYLSLLLTIDFCYSQLIFFFVYILFKKDTKIKKRWNILKKVNSLKKGEGVPLLNFEGSPGIPLLNFEGGPGVPLLNFMGSWVPGPRFPGSWSHFYTMPLICRIYLKKYLEFITAKCESTFTCSTNCLS